jgi:hypothetical protein
LLRDGKDFLLVAEYEQMGGQRQGEQFFEIDEYNLHCREVGYVWKRIEDLAGQ